MPVLTAVSPSNSTQSANPFESLVGRQDHGVARVPGRHCSEEGNCRVSITGPKSELCGIAGKLTYGRGNEIDLLEAHRPEGACFAGTSAAQVHQRARQEAGQRNVETD